MHVFTMCTLTTLNLKFILHFPQNKHILLKLDEKILNYQFDFEREAVIRDDIKFKVKVEIQFYIIR